MPSRAAKRRKPSPAAASAAAADAPLRDDRGQVTLAASGMRDYSFYTEYDVRPPHGV